MYKVIVVILPRFILIWFEVEKNIDFYESTAVHCNTSVVLYILLLQIWIIYKFDNIKTNWINLC